MGHRNKMKLYSKNFFAVVPVRKGSKGLPKKNQRIFIDKPLYLHAVNQGIKTCGQCIISTDIEEIYNNQENPNCIAVQRPIELASDNSSMTEVITHLINKLSLENGILVLLQATSPLRKDETIESMIELYSSGQFHLVMSVCKTSSSVLKTGEMKGNQFSPISQPKYCFSNRQQLPDIYKPNGAVYIFSVEDFVRFGGFSMPNIGGYVMEQSESIDIDNEDDFVNAEKVCNRLKLK